MNVQEIAKFILNLVHVAQYYKDNKKRQEFLKDNNGGDQPDFELFFEFYQKIFLFTEGSKLEKNGSKINTSVDELIHYLQCDE